VQDATPLFCGSLVDYLTAHKFVEYYLCPHILATSPFGEKMSLPALVSKLVSTSIDELSQGRTLKFVENFDGSSLREAYWTPYAAAGIGSNTVSNGIYSSSCRAYAETKNKVTFSGSKIIIESRMSGPNANHDVAVLLVDAANANNIIQFGDTNYPQPYGWGLYVSAAGAFGTSVNRGASTPLSGFADYRLTIEGRNFSLERGGSILSGTLAIPVSGFNFYIAVGSGGTTYCPSQYDYIRISTD